MLLEIILNHFIEVILGGITLAISSIISAVYLYIKRQDEQIKLMYKELTVLKQGVNGVLFDILTNMYHEKSNNGYCSIEDRKKLEKLHNAYHELGGNGTIDVLMEKMQELPTEPKANLRRVKHANNIRGT